MELLISITPILTFACGWVLGYMMKKDLWKKEFQKGFKVGIEFQKYMESIKKESDEDVLQ